MNDEYHHTHVEELKEKEVCVGKDEMMRREGEACTREEAKKRKTLSFFTRDPSLTQLVTASPRLLTHDAPWRVAKPGPAHTEERPLVDVLVLHPPPLLHDRSHSRSARTHHALSRCCGTRIVRPRARPSEPPQPAHSVAEGGPRADAIAKGLHDLAGVRLERERVEAGDDEAL